MKKIILTMSIALIPLLGISQNHSLNFDGSDDYVELNNNFDFDNTDEFTVEAWIKTGTATGFAQIVSKLNLQFRGWGMQITDSGVLGGYLFSTYLSNQRYVEGTTVLIDDTWHHVAMVFNGDNIALYVDGVLEDLTVDSGMGDLETIANVGKTRIGNYDAEGFPGEFFNGNIDEVRIWTGARSATDISDNYDTELSGTEANLIGYYKMDNLDASCDVEDCSVSEAHGERGGATGTNDTPQYDTDVAVITDVECGGDLGCELSVGDFEALQFEVYPNPSNGEFTISAANVEISEVKIINVLGAVVKVVKVENNKVDISELTRGLYILSVEAENQKSTRKIIKL